MKKWIALLLTALLLLSLAACNKPPETPTAPALTPRATDGDTTPAAETATPAPTETPAATEEPEDPGVPGDIDEPEEPDDDPFGAGGEGVLYAEPAAWCEYEDIYLPSLNREYFGDALATKVEGEMRDLYAELTRDLWDFEKEGGHGPTAGYNLFETEDTVSVLIAYDEASYGPEFYTYRSYCIDKESKQLLDVDDLCERYNLTRDELQSQLYDQRLAYYSYYRQNFYDFEEYEDLTIEDCLDYDLGCLGRVLENSPQNVVAYDEDVIGICTTVAEPGAGAGIENTVVFLGNDPDMAAYLNAPMGADFYLITGPSTIYLAAYPPDETLHLSDGEYAETALFVNNYGTVNYRFVTLEYREDDEIGGYFAYGETVAEGTMEFADRLLITIDRPEGMPTYGLVLTDAESMEGASTDYIFSYNGRFGTLALEYIASEFAVG